MSVAFECQSCVQWATIANAAVIKLALKCNRAMPDMTGHDILFIALHVIICPVTSQSDTVTVCEDVQSESLGDQSYINQAFIDMTLVGFLKTRKFELTANTEYGGAYPNGHSQFAQHNSQVRQQSSWQPDIQHLHMPLSSIWM